MIVYFSSTSENTKRFVEKLDIPAERIPLFWDSQSPLVVSQDYILVAPTYGAGKHSATVPKQVIKFLNLPENRAHLKGVIGMGNTNFGEHFCMAAEIIAAKLEVPLLYKVEILGTPEDVEKVKELIELQLS